MIKKFKFFNGSMRATLGSALVIGLFFVVSCDSGSGDPAPELYPLTGFTPSMKQFFKLNWFCH
jgi:hypothetical protein